LRRSRCPTSLCTAQVTWTRNSSGRALSLARKPPRAWLSSFMASISVAREGHRRPHGSVALGVIETICTDPYRCGEGRSGNLSSREIAGLKTKRSTWCTKNDTGNDARFLFGDHDEMEGLIRGLMLTSYLNINDINVIWRKSCPRSSRQNARRRNRNRFGRRHRSPAR
jgi:hypothetical protein